MNSQFQPVAGALIAALILIGCSGAESVGEPEIRGESWAPRGVAQDWPRMAIVNYEPLDMSDPGLLEQYARAEVIVTSAVGLWCASGNDGAVAALKSLNPDLKIVGYFSAHATWLSWGETEDRSSTTNTFGWDWYQATRPYWSYTTEGDTMMSWPGKALLNVLDPRCRQAMVQVIASHWYAHPNVIDGVFWDHFNNFLWVPDDIRGVEGHMDLDGDGIPHREDDEEMEAYRVASADLVKELRAALGDGIIEIVNGGRAAMDSTFASLVDGMMYENFPEVGFQRAGMESVLDLNRPNNLFAARSWPRDANGGPWLILSNKYIRHFIDDAGQSVQYRDAEFSRVVAALTGCLATYHGDDQTMSYSWPEVAVSLGRPTAAPEFAGRSISREFANGRVELVFSDSSGQFPFDFEINQGGTVVQSFAYPHHYP